MAKNAGDLQKQVAALLEQATGAAEGVAHAADALNQLVSELKEIEAELAAPEPPAPAQMEAWSRRLPEIRAAIGKLNLAESHQHLRLGMLFIGLLTAISLIMHIGLLDLVFTAAKFEHGEMHLFAWGPYPGMEISVAAVQLVSMLILSVLWGATGGMIASVVATAERSSGEPLVSFGLAWIVKPLRGAFVGAVIFMLVQGGLLTSVEVVPPQQGADQTISSVATSKARPFDVDPRQVFFIFALAAMAGYQERAVLQKINDVLRAILGTAAESQTTSRPKGSGQTTSG